MSTENTKSGYSAFVPLLLVALSVLVFMGWNLSLATQQTQAGRRLSEQLDEQLTQSKQAEEKLRVMMTDLVALSGTNPRAMAIVKKFQISFTPAPAATPAP